MSDAVTSEPTPVPRPPVIAPEPDRPPPPVPCNAGDPTFLVFFGILIFLAEFFWPSVMVGLFRGTGFFAWYYPRDAPDVEERQTLWVLALAFPFQVATVLFLVASLLGIWPAAVGLHGRHVGRDLFAGALGAIILTPLVLGLHNWVVWLYIHGLGIAEQRHPLGHLGGLHLSPVELALWLFVAVVAAPVLEELLFRGVFQSAARNSRWGGLVGVGAALALAVCVRYQKTVDAVRLLGDAGWTKAGPTVVDAIAPALLVVALLLALFVVQRRARSRVAPAVFGTSMLFAMIHVGVWPSPVALFVLALGLGWLKERTQSLVGPIVLHGLFNGVSCALVMVGLG